MKTSRAAKHQLGGVRSVEPRGNFVVHIIFTDGTERDMDLDPYIGTGPVFAPIRKSRGLFRQVYVDPETETLTWPNGADIAPETLYYEGDPPWADGKTVTRRPSPRRVTARPPKTKRQHRTRVP